MTLYSSTTSSSTLASGKSNITGSRGGGGVTGLQSAFCERKLSSSTVATGRMFGTTSKAGCTSTGTGGGGTKAADSGDQLEKRLQATLHKANRDRDNEHRQWVVANQRLTAVKAEVKNLQKNVTEERRKHTTTSKELNRTVTELSTMEGSVENLKRKYDFQHRDLIQKRNKINKQKEDAEMASVERQKVLNSSKALLAEQRHKMKTINEKERLEYFHRLDHAIATFEGQTKLVDLGLEDVFDDGHAAYDSSNAVDENDASAILAKNKKKRQREIDDDLNFFLMLMGDDDMIVKLIREKTERLDEEKNKIDCEILRLVSMCRSHGIDFDLDKIEEENTYDITSVEDPDNLRTSDPAGNGLLVENGPSTDHLDFQHGLKQDEIPGSPANRPTVEDDDDDAMNTESSMTYPTTDNDGNASTDLVAGQETTL